MLKDVDRNAAEGQVAANRNLDIAVILPTFNERENVPEVISRLAGILKGLKWELIFVDDDSPDGTSDVVHHIAAEDSRIRLIRRIGRCGLSSACIEGMLATSANYIAVMDADLQHDESILRPMLDKLRLEALDVVVGTRNAGGGSMGEFCASRVFLSRLGQRISRLISHCELTDPMSGFFILRRNFFLEVVHRLHGGGFKILLDILATSTRPVRVGEVGYRFRDRQFGTSKLDVNISFEYLSMIINKLSDGIVTPKHVAFLLVGEAGLLVHFAVLFFLFHTSTMGFAPAQAWAALACMAIMFLFDNMIAMRDRKLHGTNKLIGLILYCAGCSLGACANVSLAATFLRSGMQWYLAGFCGAAFSVGWNYSIGNLFSWHIPQTGTTNRTRPFVETISLR
jgi:dolichol-phosphate mannosyltransferase